jgi:DNA polymerase/3'-5' exonuclease PolX
MSNMTTTSMGELVVQLTTYRKALRRIRSRHVAQEGHDAAETIAFAWEFAGVDDATSTAKGGEVLRLAQEIDAALAEVERLIAEIRHKASLASQAAAESEVQRKAQTARLTL